MRSVAVTVMIEEALSAVTESIEVASSVATEVALSAVTEAIEVALSVVIEVALSVATEATEAGIKEALSDVTTGSAARRAMTDLPTGAQAHAPSPGRCTLLNSITALFGIACEHANTLIAIDSGGDDRRGARTFDDGPRRGGFEDGPRRGGFEDGPRRGGFGDGPRRGGTFEDGPRDGARDGPVGDRPKLNLAKRTKPAGEATDAATSSAIFGGAKPIDAEAKLREIEAKEQERRKKKGKPCLNTFEGADCLYIVAAVCLAVDY